MAESVTEDIIIDILSRLPVKSLMRFKCVSKRWRSLISDQHFAKLHLQRLILENIAPSQKIIKSNPLQTIDYEALDNGEVNDHVVVESHDLGRDEPWGLAGSCHGLVSLAVDDGLLVYNPATRESRRLPTSELVAEHEFFHGFGYNSATDDYKIVCGAFFKANDGSKECVSDILSLRSGSWRRVPCKDVPKVDGFGIYLNGALHWLVNHGSGNGIEQAIIPFGLAMETFEEAIPIPKVEAYTESGKIVFQIDVSEMILFNPEDGTYKNYPIEEDDNVESTIYVETLVSPYVGHEQ
ncbi:F-box domain-containing protein [Psidium guajava]|nr:F-box domain-containing protein [Psidium guajava]